MQLVPPQEEVLSGDSEMVMDDADSFPVYLFIVGLVLLALLFLVEEGQAWWYVLWYVAIGAIVGAVVDKRGWWMQVVWAVALPGMCLALLLFWFALTSLDHHLFNRHPPLFALWLLLGLVAVASLLHWWWRKHGAKAEAPLLVALLILQAGLIPVVSVPAVGWGPLVWMVGIALVGTAMGSAVIGMRRGAYLAGGMTALIGIMVAAQYYELGGRHFH
jgi:nitrate reductase NapE component